MPTLFSELELASVTAEDALAISPSENILSESLSSDVPHIDQAWAEDWAEDWVEDWVEDPPEFPVQFHQYNYVLVLESAIVGMATRR